MEKAEAGDECTCEDDFCPQGQAVNSPALPETARWWNGS